MSGNIDAAHAQDLIDASLLTASLPEGTPPLKLALMTAAGTNVALGTEVTGGGYARQTAAFAAASVSAGAASTSNTASIAFTNMPAVTSAAMELHDSTIPTSQRRWQGNLTAPVPTNAGDTLIFSPGSVVVSMP